MSENKTTESFENELRDKLGECFNMELSDTEFYRVLGVFQAERRLLLNNIKIWAAKEHWTNHDGFSMSVDYHELLEKLESLRKDNT